MYVCMYVCMFVNVCMYVCMYTCTSLKLRNVCIKHIFWVVRFAPKFEFVFFCFSSNNLRPGKYTVLNPLSLLKVVKLL